MRNTEPESEEQGHEELTVAASAIAHIFSQIGKNEEIKLPLELTSRSGALNILINQSVREDGKIDVDTFVTLVAESKDFIFEPSVQNDVDPALILIAIYLIRKNGDTPAKDESKKLYQLLRQKRPKVLPVSETTTTGIAASLHQKAQASKVTPRYVAGAIGVAIAGVIALRAGSPPPKKIEGTTFAPTASTTVSSATSTVNMDAGADADAGPKIKEIVETEAGPIIILETDQDAGLDPEIERAFEKDPEAGTVVIIDKPGYSVETTFPRKKIIHSTVNTKPKGDKENTPTTPKREDRDLGY